MSGFNRRDSGGRYSRSDDNYGGETEFEFSVPRQDCGKIIGRQGIKIKELQEATGARIMVAREDNGDGTRKVILRGGEDQVEAARERIEYILENDDSGGRMQQQQQSYGGGGQKEVITIDSSFVGRIIGKGGSRIRELQEETNCKISVSRDGGRYGQTDVELIGSRQNIQKAKEAIREITTQQY